MQHCNLLIACDQKYYIDWAKNLLVSIKYYCPSLKLHCHIINPTVNNCLNGVSITTETKEFVNTQSKISYLQSARFIQIANYDLQEKFVTIDADSICTRSFNIADLVSVIETQSVLCHPKKNRWLAGFVSFDNNNFRQDFKQLLFEDPIDSWLPGRDQVVLERLSTKYNYTKLDTSWMAIGKNKNSSVFLTLKGDQKYQDKYLDKFKGHII